MRSDRLRRMIVYAMWGALLFGSTFVMKAAPNVHLLALFIILLTDVYRVGALIPIYVYVFLEGVLQGFSLWWMPYLYVWTVLWALAMLVPRTLSDRVKAVVYCVLGLLHGLCFGLLWSPFQALAFGLDLRGTLIWIGSGIGFDLIHGISNACACLLAVPLIRVVKRIEKKL